MTNIIHRIATSLTLTILVSLLIATVATAETIFVDRFDDSNTATACLPFTGNDCSLRGAIILANGNGEDDTIWIVMQGTYILSLAGSGDARGDLDITDNLEIKGWNRNTVLIEASGITGGHRVFEIHPGVTATIRDVWITDSDPGATVYSGAGIWNSGTLFLVGVFISDIYTVNRGGGVFNASNSWLELHNSRVFGNTADLSGGGIYNEGTLKTFDSTIKHNYGTGSGGGIFNQTGGDAILIRSHLFHNTTYDRGGAIYNGGWVNAVNCTIASNDALTGNGLGFGGGVFNAGDLDLTNVTFNTNEALSGAAIYNQAGYQVNAVNTVFDGTCESATAGFTSLGGNIGRPASTCDLNQASDQIVTERLFWSVGYDGGLTLSFPISAGHPAIDAGINLVCPDEDQRGHSRPIDGDGDQNAKCDSGSYEYNPAEIFLDGFENGNMNFWSESVGSVS